jgi:hypothetical protein
MRLRFFLRCVFKGAFVKRAGEPPARASLGGNLFRLAVVHGRNRAMSMDILCRAIKLLQIYSSGEIWSSLNQSAIRFFLS